MPTSYIGKKIYWPGEIRVRSFTITLLFFHIVLEGKRTTGFPFLREREGKKNSLRGLILPSFLPSSRNGKPFILIGSTSHHSTVCLIFLPDWRSGSTCTEGIGGLPSPPPSCLFIIGNFIFRSSTQAPSFQGTSLSSFSSSRFFFPPRYSSTVVVRA